MVVKRRRINDEDDDDNSNPDEHMDANLDDDDEEGEDLNENLREDYIRDERLDTYDAAVLGDEDEEEGMDLAERRALMDELDRKDEAERARRRDDDGDVVDYDDEDDRDRFGEEGDSEDEEEGDVELEHMADGNVSDWITEGRKRRTVKKRFRNFLLHFEIATGENRDKPEKVYPQRIRSMCSLNSSSLLVSFQHLGESAPQLAIWLADQPRDMLEVFDEVLMEVVKSDGFFPNYDKITREVKVRITDLPIDDKLRNLRQCHLNTLIKVHGVVTRRTTVFPKLLAIAYRCVSCQTLHGPMPCDGGPLPVPPICTECNKPSKFYKDQRLSVHGNYQKVTLQERHGDVPAGRVPRYKEVQLNGDLIDTARPGEEVEVTGIFVHSMSKLSKNGFPIYGTIIEANCVRKINHGAADGTISEEDKLMIRQLSQRPDIFERIVHSVAPSIYGHKHAKTALALALFGGCAKDSGSNTVHRVRGDINVLMLGDPGVAKSQLLKYADKVAPRSVYSTGKGASAVGLTAGVHRDPLTKEWTLEGGALVLADQGVCLIDEFDKMNEQDRTSIHEAMEQQSISVSKAGIVTSLQARCAVLAAANPIGGRYDPSYTFAENVELTDPILQRFDILVVMQDIVDPVNDEQLSTFVVDSHMRAHSKFAEVEHQQKESGADARGLTDENDHPNAADATAHGEEALSSSASADLPATVEPEPLDQETLKKYISYAKTYCKPVLHNIDTAKVENLYADMRQQSAATGGVPIAVRHIESVMRMSEASAKMHLRDHVREDDVDRAISVMLESFLTAQKVSVRKVLRRSFRKYLSFGEDNSSLVYYQLKLLLRDAQTYMANVHQDGPLAVLESDLKRRVAELGIYDLRPFYASQLFRNNHLTLDAANGQIVFAGS